MNELVECEAPDLIYQFLSFISQRQGSSFGNVFKFTIGVVEDDNLVLIGRAVFHTTMFPVRMSQCNRPFPNSPQCLLQRESKSEIFAMVIGAHFDMNGN